MKPITILPVGFMTTAQADPAVAQSHALCANRNISTPVDFTQFAAASGQLGLYGLALNETAPPKGR
jgi:hypothetical protein